MKKITYITLLLILILPGCSSDDKYRANYDFPGNVWNRFDNPMIEFNIKDPGIYYDMFLTLDYVSSPERQNFTITVIMTTPSGEVRSRDLELDFGQGKEVKGHQRLSIVLRREYAFADKGKCRFEVENRSSEVNTEGMKSIGIFMRKAQ
ncbi:MAG TPA: hypothetical protein VK994_05880 [Bacteroidales bacterium]|nr:hypothetical protein [Bacteroidales bacterium]